MFLGWSMWTPIYRILGTYFGRMSKRFTVHIEEDEHGELYFTIPDEICEELGWDVGDEVEYNIVDDYFEIRRVNE